MAQPVLNIQLVNVSDSGVSADSIFLYVTGLTPTNSVLNFSSGEMEPVSLDTTTATFDFNAATMTHSLAQLGGKLSLPAITSGRLYFAFNANFSPTNNKMPWSGPSFGTIEPLFFDKLEFDTSNPELMNINTTGVDFYGASLTVTVPGGITAGYEKPRKEILSALKTVGRDSGTDSGNTGIFGACFMKDPDGAILRVLSPKSMGFADWGADDTSRLTNAKRCSHFLDSYINDHCWKPNRQFSFPDKENNSVFGTVDAQGVSLQLFSDAARTQTLGDPLPRPSTPVASQDILARYHQTDGKTESDIDWGFLLLGNAKGTLKGFAQLWSDTPAVLSIITAICRGVMHFDDGNRWLPDPREGSGATNFYDSQNNTVPVFEYARVLHDFGVNRFSYALSYDDVFSQNTSLQFKSGDTITITFHSLTTVRDSDLTTKRRVVPQVVRQPGPVRPADQPARAAAAPNNWPPEE